MKWEKGNDVESQILFYAGAMEALWINSEVTFCASEMNEKGVTKSPFVPKDILMNSFLDFIPEGVFFCFWKNWAFFF